MVKATVSFQLFSLRLIGSAIFGAAFYLATHVERPYFFGTMKDDGLSYNTSMSKTSSKNGVNTKIFRLLSISVLKVMVVRHVKAGLISCTKHGRPDQYTSMKPSVSYCSPIKVEYTQGAWFWWQRCKIQYAKLLPTTCTQTRMSYKNPIILIRF